MKRFCGTILTDLSKDFDTIIHEVRIAKLHGYGFSIELIETTLSYLQDRWQRRYMQFLFLGISSWFYLFQHIRSDVI